MFALSTAARLDNTREGERDRKRRQKRWEMRDEARQFSRVEGETVKRVQWQRMISSARRAVGGRPRKERDREREKESEWSRRPMIHSICVHTPLLTATPLNRVEEEYCIFDAFGLRNRALGALHRRGITDPIDLKTWSMKADGITLLLARVKQLRWQRKIIGRARD